MKKILQLLTIGLSVLFFTACASSTPNKNNVIENPSLLKQSKEDPRRYIYIKKDIDVKQYNKILVPKIEIKPNNENKAKTKLVKEVADYFTKELFISLNRVIKDNPGNQTMKLDIGINSIEVGYEDLEVWQFLPISLAFTAISRGTGISNKDLNIAIALRLRDPKTQDVIAMAIETRKKKGVRSIETLTFEEVQPLLDKWIDSITKRLTKLNG